MKVALYEFRGPLRYKLCHARLALRGVHVSTRAAMRIGRTGEVSLRSDVNLLSH